MNGASYQFLAGARFACNQNRRLDLSNGLNHLINRLHAIGSSDDVAKLSARALALDERIVLVLERLLFLDDGNLLKGARHFLFQ